MILLIIGIMAILLISGCTIGNDINNPSYSQPLQSPQGYVGGGCNVAGIKYPETEQSPLTSNL